MDYHKFPVLVMASHMNESLTVFGFSKGRMNPQNLSYMFFFVWGSCCWPDYINFEGIIWKVLFWGNTVCHLSSGCVTYPHHLQ